MCTCANCTMKKSNNLKNLWLFMWSLLQRYSQIINEFFLNDL